MSADVIRLGDKPDLRFLSAREKFNLLPAQKRHELLSKMSDEDAARLHYDWEYNGRPKQLAPDYDKSRATSFCMCRYMEAQSKTETKLKLEQFPSCTKETMEVIYSDQEPDEDGWSRISKSGPWMKIVTRDEPKVCNFRVDWSVWLLLAGRGFGKTRVGAELVRHMVETGQAKRIHIIAPTAADARDVAIEGESGLLNISPSWNKPLYESTKRRITWPNGATASLFSAEEPERLRGPQCDFSWCLIGETLIETEFGQKPIREVEVGDLVWTRKGLRKVYDVQMTGYKPVMTVSTVRGKTLTGTGEHKIWIDGLNWVEIVNLRTGDVVFTIENYRYEIHEREYILKVGSLSSEREVWNLSVEDAHEYFANGVLVKNCDELAAWDPNAQQMVWDMMNFGLRLGKNPRAVVTTTPKPTILIQNLVKQSRDPEAKTIITTGSTYENRTNLAAPFMRQITQYEGTNLGRQEIYAELIDIEESGILKRSWFKKWPAKKEMPFFEYVIQSYDTAFTEKTENDPTGCLVLGIFRPDQDSPHCAMILDCWTEHLKYPELRKKATDDYKNTYGDQEAPVDILLIEDKGSGIPLIQDLQRAGLPVRKYNPGRPDKVMRLHAVSHLVYNGRVYIPESKQVPGEFVTWSEDFLREVCSFPNSAHDEMVDTLSQGLALLRDQGWISVDPDREQDEEEEEVWGEEYSNPYCV